MNLSDGTPCPHCNRRNGHMLGCPFGRWPRGWEWLSKLFAPAGQIPKAVNRKDRRTRQSIARRQSHQPALARDKT